MVVYIDVVMLENFIINFFLLLITTQVMRVKTKYRYIFMSSILGAIYTLFLFIPQLKITTNLIGKFIFAYFMIVIILKGRGVMTVLKGFVVFLMISFMFSGVCFMFAFVENDYILGGAFTITSYSAKYLLFGGMLIYIVINRIMAYLKDRMVLSSFIYDLEVNIDNSISKITAFLDTGNELIEPITALPVIIVEREILKHVNLNTKEYFNVPYKVINGENGMMKGIRAKEVKLFKNNSYISSREAIICFCDGKLSVSGDYEALLSRGII